MLEMLKKLLGKKPAEEKGRLSEYGSGRQELGDSIVLTYDYIYNGYGGYAETSLTLHNTKLDIHAPITDEKGYFIDFPGVVEGPWRGLLTEVPFAKRTLFRTSVGCFFNGRTVFEWCLQPDGRYFEDEDGFGGSNCCEVNLYSYIDDRGRFLCPFGSKDLWHEQREEREKERAGI